MGGDIRFSPPENVARIARQGLDWLRKRKRGDRGLAHIAQKLSAMESLTVNEWDELVSTHMDLVEREVTQPGWFSGREGYPNDQRVNFHLVGGPAGLAWIESLTEAQDLESTDVPEDDSPEVVEALEGEAPDEQGVVVEAVTPVSVVEPEAAASPKPVTLREGRSALVRLINPGWGSSGFYSEDLLKRDGSKAFPAGTQMFINHATESEMMERPEGDLRNLAGVLEQDAEYLYHETEGPGLYARVKIFSDHESTIKEKAPFTGLSISASGLYHEGEAAGVNGRIIEELFADPGNSVDYVTKAGRGGKVVALMESVSFSKQPKCENLEVSVMDVTSQTPDRLNEKALKGQIDSLSDRLTQLTESLKGTQRENEKLREGMVIRDAHAFAMRYLEEKQSSLTPKARMRVAEAVAKEAPSKDGKFDAELAKGLVDAEEREWLAVISESLGSGEISNPGNGSNGDLDASELDAMIQSQFQALGLSESASKAALKGRG